jgi:nucleoside-diphosphate-sugar epimerase
MKIFVAGGTGVLGRRAVRELVRAGHDVTAVARSDEKAALLRDLGAAPIVFDPFDATRLNDAVRGHDVVMNLATHIPAPTKSVLPGAWKENDRIRTELSRLLVDAAIANGARRYIQESIAFMYTDLGDAWIDEDVPLDPVEYAMSITDAEAQARRFTDSGGATPQRSGGAVGVVLRFGMFYAADTTHTKTQMRTARRGFSPFLGPDDGYQATIHLDDAAAAVVAALDVDAGVWNVVDDEPLTRRDAADALAALLGKKRLRPVPKAMIKMGGDKFVLLTRSQRVSNERLRKATAWEPRYPSVREGLRAVVADAAT